VKNALVIAAREFEEKRFVAYAAVAFAILPFIIGILPGINNRSPREVIAIAAVVLGTGFTLGLAVITGASFIGRDLSDGRMSFYFSRPAGSFSIWFGKLTAGILMIVGCFGFIVVPARLAAGDHWKKLFSTTLTWWTAYILAIAVGLFLIAHVIGTFARSRSPLIALDFIAAVICGVSVRYLLVPLMAGEAFVIIDWLSSALAISAALAVICGGAWQLERGRTDRRRSHLALSQFLWGAMAVVLLIAAAYVAWVVSEKPGDLTANVQATRSTSGPFAVLTGMSKGRADYRAAFLINADDGSVTRIDSWAAWTTRYTRDGRSAVVLRRADNVANIMIYTQGKTEPIDTGLTMTAGDYVLSDDATRIATISRPMTLSIYDVAQKRSLASARLPDATFVQTFFVTNDIVRAYLNVPNGMKIMELDARTRGLRETGFVPSGNAIFIYPDSSSMHMLMKTGPGGLTLNDARTGTPLRTLATGTQLKTARYLRDGRIAFVDGPNSATVLHILATDGTPQRDIPLGGKTWITIVGDDGTRIVLNDVDAPLGKRMLEAVNIDHGIIERREPIVDWVPSGAMDTRPAIQPLREVFYVGANGHMTTWNPATGAKRAIT